MPSSFLDSCPEISALNQYWYSQNTIDAFVAEIVSHLRDSPNSKERSVGLVSCPSIYFSLPEEARSRCWVLDLDEQWKDDPGFVK